MIRHFVHLHFAPDTPDATKQDLWNDLAGLDQHIAGIIDFQHRENISTETDVVRGFDEMFWFDFANTDVRDAYLIHPAHQAIGRRIVASTTNGPDGIFVCDVEL